MTKINVSLTSVRTDVTPSAKKIFRVNLPKQVGWQDSPEKTIPNGIKKVAMEYQRTRGSSIPEWDTGNNVCWVSVVKEIPEDLWNKHGFYVVDKAECRENIKIRHYGDYIELFSPGNEVDIKYIIAQRELWDFMRIWAKTQYPGMSDEKFQEKFLVLCEKIAVTYAHYTDKEFQSYLYMAVRELPDNFLD